MTSLHCNVLRRRKQTHNTHTHAHWYTIWALFSLSVRLFFVSTFLHHSRDTWQHQHPSALHRKSHSQPPRCTQYVILFRFSTDIFAFLWQFWNFSFCIALRLFTLCWCRAPPPTLKEQKRKNISKAYRKMFISQTSNNCPQTINFNIQSNCLPVLAPVTPESVVC